MNNWPTSPIENVVSRLIDYRGKTPKKTSAGVKLITAKVIKGGTILDGDHEYIAEEDYDSWMRRGLPQQHDILITTEAPLGEVAQLRTSERIALAQRVILLRGNPNLIDQAFFYQALKAPFMQAGLQARATGTTVAGIKQSELRQVEVPLPPLPTQRRIASILSAYDDLIENNTRRVRVLEDMARALYREWFVEYRFPGHEQAEFVEDEQGRRPKEWEWSRLGDVAVNFDRHRRPLSKMQREKFKGPYPYYGAAKVFDYVAEFIFDGKYLLLAEDGSVETKDGKPVLQLVNEKFWPNNHTHILQGRDYISTEYLYLVLSEVEVRPYITGAAQPKITQANMNSIPVLQATTQVHAAFDKHAQALIGQVLQLELRNANLRRTRDLLLPRLVSGELDVSELEIAGVEDTPGVTEEAVA